jgi:polyol permease family
MSVATNGREYWLDRIGIPHVIVFGYIGILIFMMGDGLETAWLSPYLTDHGLSMQQSAVLFSAYGVTLAISSWFSGVLVEAIGPKRTMWLGLLLWVIGQVGFVGLGVRNLDYGVMVPFYSLRGFGYPLFAYSFMVWIAYRSSEKRLGAAVGWFWFVFTGGLNVLGAYYSVWAIPRLGHIGTLWSALLWVILGGIFALIVNRDRLERNRDAAPGQRAKELLKGLTILGREPKVLMGGIVRTINTTAQFAFPVFLPQYMAQHGFSTQSWLGIWGSIFTANIAFNLIFGFVGDRFGWRNTVMWFGGVGCAVSTLVLYYMPQWSDGNHALVYIAGMVWGALLAGYVPLSALMPSLVKEDKGAAISILNLGAGLPTFVGPAIVGLFIGSMGSAGVVWILAILYLISAILTYFVRLPGNAKVATSHSKQVLIAH